MRARLKVRCGPCWRTWHAVLHPAWSGPQLRGSQGPPHKTSPHPACLPHCLGWLQAEQEDKERRKKEKAEAHLYTLVRTLITSCGMGI